MALTPWKGFSRDFVSSCKQRYGSSQPDRWHKVTEHVMPTNFPKIDAFTRLCLLPRDPQGPALISIPVGWLKWGRPRVPEPGWLGPCAHHAGLGTTPWGPSWVIFLSTYKSTWKMEAPRGGGDCVPLRWEFFSGLSSSGCSPEALVRPLSTLALDPVHQVISSLTASEAVGQWVHMVGVPPTHASDCFQACSYSRRLLCLQCSPNPTCWGGWGDSGPSLSLSQRRLQRWALPPRPSAHHLSSVSVDTGSVNCSRQTVKY